MKRVQAFVTTSGVCILSPVWVPSGEGYPVACRVGSGITGPPGALRDARVGRAGVGGAADSRWIPHFSVEQKLSGSHKALVEMQDVVAELLRSVPREHPATKVRGLWAGWH